MTIAGMMVVGAGESKRYLKHALDDLKRLCDKSMVVLNNADDDTIEMVKSYGFLWYEDNREWGRFQPQIKEELVRSLALFRPQWVVAMDADERFDDSVDRKVLEKLAMPDQLAWYFFVVNHWNDEQHHRPSLNFWNIRYFKYDKDRGFDFEKKQVHCGLAPKWAYHKGSYAPHILRHYGLMNPNDRLKKKERYDLYDPKAVHKGREYYDEIQSKRLPETFSIEDMRKAVQDEVSKYKLKDKTKDMTMNKSLRFFYFQREDGSIVEIPEKNVDQTKKLHPNWVVVREYLVGSEQVENASNLPPIENDPMECGLCGFVAKSEHALNIHKGKQHKV